MSFPGIDIGRSATLTSGDWLAVTSNNIANLQTNAFKRSVASFQDIAYVTYRQFQSPAAQVPGQPVNPNVPNVPGVQGAAPLGAQLGDGVTISQILTDFSPGPLVPGRNMDVYISGQGFFQVTDLEGNIYYTRLGAFQPKEDGSAGPVNLQLTNQPYLLFPRVDIPGEPGFPLVNADGTIVQGTATAGRIQLASFVNPEGLEQVGDLLFRETGASGPPILGFPGDPGFGTTLDGFLEGSNVELAPELTDLIFASQLFNYGAQSITTGNQEILTVLAVAQS